MLARAMEKNDGLAQCLSGAGALSNQEITPRYGMHLMMKGVVDGTTVSHFYLHNIAMNFAQGIGVTKSADNAAKIAGIILDSGNPYGFYTLGKLYQDGAWGKADLAKAREFYQKGAAEGVNECVEALKTLK